MSGLIGKKIGMTSIFDESGKNIPCTVIEAGPCIVTQVRSEAIDGYHAIQLGFDDGLSLFYKQKTYQFSHSIYQTSEDH